MPLLGPDGQPLRRAPASAPRLKSLNLAGTSMSGGYEGMLHQRRLFGFRPAESAINSLLILAAPTLRARARWLVRNNAYAKRAQRIFASYLVGTGIMPTPKVADPALRKQILELWEDWTDEADFGALTDLYGLQLLIARALFEAGECFVRFRPADPAMGLSVPLQLQVLESEYCPYELNLIAENGNVIRAGIEFDNNGKRVAYWFWRTHPFEFALPNRELGYVRVPAAEVMHVYEPLRPEQIRGVSWLSAAIVRAYLLDQYEDAELDRKKVAALFAGFITRPNADDPNPVLDQQDQPAVGYADQSQNATGEVTAGLTPGMLQELGPGEEIAFSEPADVGGNFEAFEYRQILSLCAAMDAPYAGVTGDYAKANYSSLRAAQLDLKRTIEPLQHAVMVFQFCRPAYRRFIADAVLAGELSIRASAFNTAPRPFLRVSWTPPKFEWVDPLKDVQAARLAVRSGFESRSAVVRSVSGRGVQELDAEMALDNASSDRNGLVLDSDPRRTDARGSAPPPDAGAPQSPDQQVLDQDDDDDEPDQEVA